MARVYPPVKMTTVKFDEKTQRLLDDLKSHYGCSNRNEILRKAIALMIVAMEADKIDAKLIVVGPQHQTKEIII